MARGRQPHRSGLKRRVATRDPKRTFLVLCEGKRTEPDYLEAVKRRRECDGSAGKEVDGALYMAERWTAVAHARKLRAKHLKDESVFPDDNPSSGVFELLEAIEQRSGN